MKFVILGFDGPDGAAKRKIYRPAHLAKMELLNAQGRVLLAGPLTDKSRESYRYRSGLAGRRATVCSRRPLYR